MYLFGPGVLWATPITDAYGTAISNPTPVMLAGLQELSFDLSKDMKQLYGTGQFPIDVAAGKAKIAVKAKYVDVSAIGLDAILFGQGLTVGANHINFDNTGIIIPTLLPTITLTPPESGTYANDLGVRNAAYQPMTRVATAPATNQYTVTPAGAYSFAAADAGKTVFISYSYTTTAATSRKQTITNLLMGQAPKFRADYFTKYDGKQTCLTLYRCTAAKLGLASKLDDYMIPDLEIDPMADIAGNVFSLSVDN